METQSLWPDFKIETVRSPKTILKEQAGYLAEKTGNILSADVSTNRYKSSVTHEFFVIAPILNNYRYTLFSVNHPIVGYYPVMFNTYDITSMKEKKLEARSEEEFIALLSQVFSDPETIKIISSLLSQSVAE